MKCSLGCGAGCSRAATGHRLPGVIDGSVLRRAVCVACRMPRAGLCELQAAHRTQRLRLRVAQQCSRLRQVALGALKNLISANKPCCAHFRTLGAAAHVARTLLRTAHRAARAKRALARGWVQAACPCWYSGYCRHSGYSSTQGTGCRRHAAAGAADVRRCTCTCSASGTARRRVRVCACVRACVCVCVRVSTRVRSRAHVMRRAVSCCSVGGAA